VVNYLHRLHRFTTWTCHQIPQQWKDANIVTIYKRKGDRAVCGNSRGRGIFLLSVASNVLAGLLEHVVDIIIIIIIIIDIVVPESQCGFRRHRDTIT